MSKDFQNTKVSKLRYILEPHIYFPFKLRLLQPVDGWTAWTVRWTGRDCRLESIVTSPLVYLQVVQRIGNTEATPRVFWWGADDVKSAVEPLKVQKGSFKKVFTSKRKLLVFQARTFKRDPNGVYLPAICTRTSRPSISQISCQIPQSGLSQCLGPVWAGAFDQDKTLCLNGGWTPWNAHSRVLFQIVSWYCWLSSWHGP